MAFNILYVEDEKEDYEPIETAINEFNKKANTKALLVERAKDPEEMFMKLNLHYDVILADIYFFDKEKREPGSKLNEIIGYVQKWSRENNGGRSLPIIAYSRWATLQECLEKSDELYDIWDKNSTSHQYIIWRISKLAIELSKNKPDTYLQKVIREMNHGAIWHDEVIKMAIEYNSGWTEFDQIERASEAIFNIAGKMKSFEPIKKMWNIMIKGESISKAISDKIRGHARHVVNVFWMGYYLIYENQFNYLIEQWWDSLKKNRGKMEAVTNETATDAFSNIWFYAGLFHDFGHHAEHEIEVITHLKNLHNMFGQLAIPIPEAIDLPSENLPENIILLINEMEDELRDTIKLKLEDSLRKKHPDHGLISAYFILKNITDEKQKCYAREAARAILLHNIISEFDEEKKGILNWKSDPVGCLLILFDQLQSWERENHNRSITISDEPDRAELTNLFLLKKDGRLSLNISIDYIAPNHVLKVSEIYKRVKKGLNYILLDKPNRALNLIKTPWPFDLNVSFSLSRDKITELSF